MCGAIHYAAGLELTEACTAIGSCPTGEARITPGFALPAWYVLHAVGPRWQGGTAGEAALLAFAYRASMRLADERGLTTIAFPAISTGIYGYPLHEATVIAVKSVRAALADGSAVERVIFACFDARTLAAYRSAGVLA